MEPRGSVDWEQGQPHRARPAENAPPRAASPSQSHGRLPRNLLLPHTLCQNPAARTSKAGETGARQVAESLPRAARVQMADRWRKHGGTNGLRELHAREDETPPLGRFWPGYGRDLDAEAARRKPCWTTPGPDRGRGQMPIAEARGIIARTTPNVNRTGSAAFVCVRLGPQAASTRTTGSVSRTICQGSLVRRPRRTGGKLLAYARSSHGLLAP